MATPFYLGVDCTKDSQLILFVFTDDVTEKREINDRTQNVLTHIDAFISEKKLTKESLQGIVVATGSGSFMSNRMSCTLANGIAQAFHIPALAVRAPILTSFTELEKQCANSDAASFAITAYASEPNIRLKQP